MLTGMKAVSMIPPPNLLGLSLGLLFVPENRNVRFLNRGLDCSSEVWGPFSFERHTMIIEMDTADLPARVECQTIHRVTLAVRECCEPGIDFGDLFAERL